MTSKRARRIVNGSKNLMETDAQKPITQALQEIVAEKVTKKKRKIKMKKNILVGVTSGIAIYKSLDLVSMLVKAGYEVNVVMTENATKLINPLIFETISQNKVYSDVFERDMDSEVKHIKLAKEADCIVLAPLTANTMAKIAYGIADNLITNIVLAHTKKNDFSTNYEC